MSVLAVVVNYNTCLETLQSLLQSLVVQVDAVTIIDNNSTANIGTWLGQQQLETVSIQSLTSNKGIATAHNKGIRWAREQHAEFVLLLDQDSIPALDMVDKLLTAIQKEPNIAAVGPKYLDIKGNHKSPFVKLIGCKLHRIACADHEMVAVDHLVSSGSLISMAALHKIGGMQEQLFIDYVDTEWCLRAIHKGYALFGVGAAQMAHSIGDQQVSIFGRKLAVHSPLRQFYVIRNGLWLLRQPWVSWRWRCMDIQRLFLIYITYSLFIGKRFQKWKMMNKGIWRAIIGKMETYK